MMAIGFFEAFRRNATAMWPRSAGDAPYRSM
jgi:hypothetical protein